MDSKEKGFWTVGLFFAGIGLFVGFLVGFSINGSSGAGAITGGAIYEPSSGGCFDADGGTNVDVFGYAVDSETRYFDNCQDAQYLYEGYCSGGKVHVMKYKCPYGCDANRCLPDQVY